MNKLETVVLDNGLRIFLYRDLRRHTTLFQHVTLFGGTYKDFKVDNREYHFQDGVAHILEHYIVECNDVGNFLKELGKKQMNTNAATYYNMTSFYFDTVEDVNFGIKTMLNGIYNVKFREDKLEKLKNPIYQEIRGRMDNKFYHSNNLTLNNLFKKIKFRNIGGEIEEVEKTTVEDLKTCYEAFYQPSNQFILVAGNFNKDEVLTEIKDFYSNLKIDKKSVELIDLDEGIEVKKKEDILYFSTPLEYVEFSFKIDINKYTNKERLDLDFYLGCFYNHFFGNTSILHKDLIEKKVITSGISCSDIKLDKFLIINIGAYTHNVNYFKEVILKAIKELKYFDLNKFDLDKKSAVLRIILRDESIMKMVVPFVDNVVNFNYPYLDRFREVQKLNYNDYVKYIKDLDFSNYTITIIKEKENS